MSKIKILMDVNSIVVPTGRKYLSGIGRTTLELLLAFQKMKNLPVELRLFTQRLPDCGIDQYRLPFEHLYFPLPGSGVLKDWVNRFRVKEHFYKYDLYHLPHNYDQVSNASKTVLTIHDAMFFSFPEAFLRHDQAREMCPKLARKCRSIVTCSHSSKSDIVNYMNIPPEKITVIPWGVSHIVFHPEINPVEMHRKLEERGLFRPYFVMISCDIGRKNTIGLMNAFRIYLQDKNAEHDLVLAWNNPPRDYLEEFAPEISTGRIRILHNVDDQLLRHLYNGATASFFPSKYEGFGLPVLESMACGTPVVTCDNSSLKEAGGDVAIYVEPDDVEQMSQCMKDFESGKIDRKTLGHRSLIHAARYNWQRTAEKYLRFYQTAYLLG
jgi:Glycosyltransferase